MTQPVLISKLKFINKTDITFTNDELSLPNKGLKYNLNYKHKNWMKPLP